MSRAEKIWGVLLVATGFTQAYLGSYLFWYDERLLGGLLFISGLCLVASILALAASRERKEPPPYPGPRGTTTTDPTGLGWPGEEN